MTVKPLYSFSKKGFCGTDGTKEGRPRGDTAPYLEAREAILGLGFEMFQILGEKLGYLLESADILRISLHQGAMRFQTGSGHFLFGRIERSMWPCLNGLRRLQRAT